MPDVEQELARFGRWLDTEIETHAGDEIRPWAAPVEPSGRRWRRWTVMGAAAAVAVAVLVAATLLRPSSEPAISPGPTTTAPATTAPPSTTASASPSTHRVVTTASAAPTSAGPVTVASVASVESSSTDASTTATTGARSTTAAASTDPPLVPPASTPAPATTAPLVATTESVTTAPPPATTAATSCSRPSPQAVGRTGNVVYYRTCVDGIHYSGVAAAVGWMANITAKGPPSVSVTFTNGSTSVSCTLSYDAADGVVATSGDC